MEGHWKFLGGGGGVLNAKFLEKMYENKLEFPGRRGGGGAKQKAFRGGSTNIFSNFAKWKRKICVERQELRKKIPEFTDGIQTHSRHVH